MQATVLFADIVGSGKLVDLVGRPVAMKALEQCMKRLSKAVESTGGKVTKTRGSVLMALFNTPERAARGAAAMHAAIDAMPSVGKVKLGVHVGFHSGPVMPHNKDLLDDTVKFAARLLEEARRGQTLTSRETAALLGTSGAYRVARRKSVGSDLEAFEIMRGKQNAVVQLSCRGQSLSVSRENEVVSIGRDRGCSLVVGDRMASRRHCTVKLHDERFFLEDHSANGTLLSFDGQPGMLLKGRTVELHDAGLIVFGPQRFEDSDPIYFRCV